MHVCVNLEFMPDNKWTISESSSGYYEMKLCLISGLHMIKAYGSYLQSLLLHAAISMVFPNGYFYL